MESCAPLRAHFLAFLPKLLSGKGKGMVAIPDLAEQLGVMCHK